MSRTRSVAGAVVLALVAATAPLAGQGTATVPAHESIYRDADRLLDAGLVVAVRGQRPYSRDELRRIARVAGEAIAAGRAASASLPLLRAAIARLERAGRGAAEAPVVRALVADALQRDAESRPLLSNGVGRIEADVEPLTAYRAGRPFGDGLNGGAGAAVEAAIGPRATLTLRPEVMARSASLDARLASGAVRARFGNLALTVGREHTTWAQEPGSGLFFSTNAPALDMVRIATDRPAVGPGILRWLGPVAGTLQVADAGRSAARSHARIVSYKLSTRPVPELEFAAAFSNMFGGSGSRGSPLGRRLQDLFPPIDLLFRHDDATIAESNKQFGFDASLRLPRAGGLIVYAELGLEDFDAKRVDGLLRDDAAWVAGLRMPVLGHPSLAARVSYHRLGLRYYTHTPFEQGFTRSRFLLGDALGRDSDALYASLEWARADGLAMELQGAVEQRRNNSYDPVKLENGALRFEQTGSAPQEHRRRVTATLRRDHPAGTSSLLLRGALERVRDFANVASPRRTAGVVELSLSLHP